MPEAVGMTLPYWHVDVFSPQPFGGNSLAVFPDAPGLSGWQMQEITRELRHFESVFLTQDTLDGVLRARVFDLFGELDFAGHPILGAAVVAHQLSASGFPATLPLALNSGVVSVALQETPAGMRATMDQGRPEFLGEIPRARYPDVVEALSLTESDLDSGMPLEVVSTGLRYLIVPLVSGLEQSRIISRHFEQLLESLGAEFAYLVDVRRLEGRHWNNDGIVEDAATGSGAGCVAAYLLRHGVLAPATDSVLAQGRFIGRASQITIRAEGTPDNVARVSVGGDVCVVGSGLLFATPRDPSNAA